MYHSQESRSRERHTRDQTQDPAEVLRRGEDPDRFGKTKRRGEHCKQGEPASGQKGLKSQSTGKNLQASDVGGKGGDVTVVVEDHKVLVLISREGTAMSPRHWNALGDPAGGGAVPLHQSPEMLLCGEEHES